MFELLRLLMALLAAVGQGPTAADRPQPIIIEPAGPPQFCPPGKEWCR